MKLITSAYIAITVLLCTQFIYAKEHLGSYTISIQDSEVTDELYYDTETNSFPLTIFIPRFTNYNGEKVLTGLRSYELKFKAHLNNKEMNYPIITVCEYHPSAAAFLPLFKDKTKKKVEVFWEAHTEPSEFSFFSNEQTSRLERFRILPDRVQFDEQNIKARCRLQAFDQNDAKHEYRITFIISKHSKFLP